MCYKPRKEPEEIKLLKHLNNRMELPPDKKQRYQNLVKGYEGEVQFDAKTAHLTSKFFFLNDLLLESNNTKFQLDSTIITENFLVLCEVKNYQGDYYYHLNEFHKVSTRQTITNPLHQSNRSKTLLQQLLKNNGFKLPIENHLIFINPEFFLYNAPQAEPITYFTQLNRYLTDLSRRPASLHSQHRNLADFLFNRHIIESPYDKLPPYKYSNLRRGMTCAICDSFEVIFLDKKILACRNCGHQELIQAAVVRSVEEFRALFPDMKITTNIIRDWCGAIELNRKIRRILPSNYQIISKGKYTFYVSKDINP